MTRKEAMRQNQLFTTLESLGFSQSDAIRLRRISLTLRRWHELECGSDNGCIERDETTGKPFWRYSNGRKGQRVADREKGALRRQNRIFETVPFGLSYFVQGDPRGAALYIIRPGDVPAGSTVESCYSRGIVVY